jgi:alpha-galactosidase
MDRIGFSQIGIAAYNKPGHWNDPDMLEIGNGGMNADEYRTHMSLWSMLSAPLIAGNDLRSMSDETKSILMNSDVIAVDQDPAANPAKLVNQQGDVEVLSRRMQDGSVIIGLFNRSGAPEQAHITWADLKLTKAPRQIRDLWKHTDATATENAYQTFVPAHGVVLLQVR